MKIILSATLTQDPSKLSQLDLHHPILLTSGMKRYRLPEKLQSFKLVHVPLSLSFFFSETLAVAAMYNSIKISILPLPHFFC